MFVVKYLWLKGFRQDKVWQKWIIQIFSSVKNLEAGLKQTPSFSICNDSL